MGVALGGTERQDEPRGADRRRLGFVLRDGALGRARKGGHAAREARDVGHRHVPAGRGDREGRPDGPRHGARPRRRRLRRRGRGCEGELPGLEGARRHPRGLAGRRARELTWAAVAALDDLIAELERSYTETQARISDPAVYNDHREAADVGRRLKQLEGPYRLAQQWRQASADLEAARNDPELAEMAADYEAEVERLEEELKLALTEHDPADDKDVIIEIRQGV